MAIALNDLQPIYRGDSRSYNINITKGNGVPEPINGWKFFFTVKLSYRSPDKDAAIQKDVTSHLDPENGKTIIALVHDDTDIEPGLYWYDIQAKRPDGSIITLARGRLEITIDITRRVD